MEMTHSPFHPLHPSHEHPADNPEYDSWLAKHRAGDSAYHRWKNAEKQKAETEARHLHQRHESQRAEEEAKRIRDMEFKKSFDNIMDSNKFDQHIEFFE